MKLVRESLNELQSFKRGIDPYKRLNLGNDVEILKKILTTFVHNIDGSAEDFLEYLKQGDSESVEGIIERMKSWSFTSNEFWKFTGYVHKRNPGLANEIEVIFYNKL